MNEHFVKKNDLLFIIVLIYLCVSYVSSTNKRGIAWPLEKQQDSLKLFTGGKVNWFYNWSPDKKSDVKMEFVPMYWSSRILKPQEFVKKVLSQHAKVILGFNEPEHGTQQAHMTPSEAAKIWKTYIEPLRKKGIRLGSPSITSTENGVKWLQEFLKLGTKVDFLALHWYGEGVDNFIKYITDTHNRLGSHYPVWVTEFACTSWKSNQPVSQKEINLFLQQSISRLDKLPWVERYAWFGASRHIDPALGNGVRLINGNGKLSDLGQKYLHR
jgi:hypothetical protein